jgi:hypothetical protein
MVYTSDNPDFLVELQKKYKESIYCVYYIIKGRIHIPPVYQSVLASAQDWIPGKPSRDIATLSLEYLTSLNTMVATMLKIDDKLAANASFSEVVEFFDLPHVTLDNSKHWGNYYWTFLHYTSIYMNIMKDNEQLYDEFYNVILNLRMILPCNQCLVNYQSKIEPKAGDPSNVVTIKYTILVLAKTDAIRAIYDLHSLVNEHTAFGKYKDYTFEDFLKTYDLKEASE